MPDLDQLLKRETRTTEDFSGLAYTAKVAQTASSLTDEVSVVIPAFSRTIRHGPCKWMPRGEDLPSKGDKALVVIDEEQDPWIVVWWPS